MGEARGSDDYSRYRGKPPAQWRGSSRLAWLIVVIAALLLLALAGFIYLSSIDSGTFG